MTILFWTVGLVSLYLSGLWSAHRILRVNLEEKNLTDSENNDDKS